MKVYHVPQEGHWPATGGVREHIRLLFKHMRQLGVEFVDHPHQADIVHVQSSYPPPHHPMSGRPWVDVYTCHGGFIPSRLAQVDKNLSAAKEIISVAQWIADVFFPEHAHKTTVIPNGVDLSEWQDIGRSGLEPGYILWGKEFLRNDWVWFHALACERPDLRFVTTLALEDASIPQNMTVIGLQTPDRMRSIINDCAVYVSTGSEVCPTLVLEAWACGKPTLVWNGHGNAELFTKNNVYHYPRSGAAYNLLTEMIDGLQVCLDNAREFGNFNSMNVGLGYNWEQLSRLTMEVYERCVK